MPREKKTKLTTPDSDDVADLVFKAFGKGNYPDDPSKAAVEEWAEDLARYYEWNYTKKVKSQMIELGVYMALKDKVEDALGTAGTKKGVLSCATKYIVKSLKVKGKQKKMVEQHVEEMFDDVWTGESSGSDSESESSDSE
jgi:hypothetical protein